VHDNRAQRNVESEARDPDSLLAWYRTLLARRAAREALREGRLELASETSRHVIRFDRISPHERLVVVANLGDTPTELGLGVGATLLAASDQGCALDRGALTLPPHAAIVARHE
jgi:glycosidase